MEEVRRILLKKFGEKTEDGPNSLYACGLWVRTSMNPVMQDAAAEALREGLARSTARPRLGRSDKSIDVSVTGQHLDRTDRTGFPDWRKAVVLSKSGGEARIGFSNGLTATLSRSAALMQARRRGNCLII
jgi:penicillin-binding protein 1A